VQNAAPGAAELNAKIAGLHRHFLDRIRDIEALRDTRVLDFVIVRTVQQVVVGARTLTVYPKTASHRYRRTCWWHKQCCLESRSSQALCAKGKLGWAKTEKDR